MHISRTVLSRRGCGSIGSSRETINSSTTEISHLNTQCCLLVTSLTCTSNRVLSELFGFSSSSRDQTILREYKTIRKSGRDCDTVEYRIYHQCHRFHLHSCLQRQRRYTISKHSGFTPNTVSQIRLFKYTSQALDLSITRVILRTGVNSILAMLCSRIHLSCFTVHNHRGDGNHSTCTSIRT